MSEKFLPAAHFLSTQHLTHAQIFHLLDQAQHWINPAGQLLLPAPLLKNKIMANLFFENSTRTRCSFEISGYHLGMQVLNFDVNTSSTQKGESILDSVRYLQAMGVELFVIRHRENGLPAWLAKQLGSSAAIINGGDGTGEHPTQALLDIFTIRRYKTDFTKLRMAIVGDIRHSRVAHSLCYALTTLGVPDIRLVGPAELLPDMALTSNITRHEDLISGIEHCDVVMALRIQTERMQENTALNREAYFQQYGLTAQKLRHAKTDAIIMHPGPMNRGVEIESMVADGAQSVIFEQAKFGVAVRMAIMVELLTHAVD